MPENIVSNDTGDAWVCVCGNQPHLNGFYPSTPEGAEVEPTEAEWDGKHMVCADCKRVMDQDTHRPRPTDSPLPTLPASYDGADPEDVSHVVTVVRGPSK